MNSILLFLGGLLALAFSALFAVPYFIDWNDYHDVFEAQASRLIGRQVDVGGDVSLTLLPAPVLRFETINVADAEGKFDTPFAAAKSFTVWLSVPPLLRGTIEARSVEINQPVVNLRIAKDGTGNWSKLGGEAAELPFMPKEVTLNSVQISDATINIWRENPEPDTVIDKLDGEFTARSLQGPFKFSGQFRQDGKHRELRISTGRREEDGQLHLKAGFRDPEARENYVIDGAVRGLDAIPVFKGTFHARFADENERADEESEEKKSQAAAPFEIKAEMYAGLTGALFNKMELLVTKNGKPQTVRGLLDVKFEKGLIVAGTFSSRWVDLDSWSGPGGDTPPTLKMSIIRMANQLLSRASGVREGTMRVFFDQAVLAGDLTKNVQLALSAADNELSISRLSAKLPGEIDLRLKGVLTADEGGATFKGPVSASGRSLSRLLRWAGIADEPGAATQSGDFSIKGELVAGPRRLSLERGEGKLFGSAFTGSFEYRGGEDGEVSVTLKSDRMELDRVLGSSASAKSLWAALDSSAGKDGDKSAKDHSPLEWLGKLRAEADVKIGAVSLAGIGESALEARLSLSQGTLDIRRLQLASGSNVSLQAGGRLSGLGDRPQGNLTLAVQADTGKGIASLGEFLDMPNLVRGSPERLASLAPVQLTAAIRSTEAGQPGLDIQLEGSLGMSDLLVKADLQGVPAQWKSAQVALQGSMTNASSTDLLRQLRPHLKENDLTAFGAGAGTLSLEASGAANAGLQTKVVLDAGGTSWTTQGTYRLAEGGGNFSGTTNFSAPNTAAGLSLFGIRIAPGHGAEPSALTANIEATDGVYRLQDLKGEFGGASFAGQAEIKLTGDRPVLGVQITASEASLPRLLAPMVAWETNGENSQEIRGVSNIESYWPDGPFNTELLVSTDGTLSLNVERLRLTGGLFLDKASMQAELSHGSLKVSALEGGLYGGTVKISGELSARGDTMSLDAKAQASGLRLERMVVTSGGGGLVLAPADITMALQSEGLTPRGLASGLSGTGKLELGGGQINGFSLGAAHAAASSARREKKEVGIDEEELGRRIAENLKSSKMEFSQITAPFTVNNGILEFEKIALSDVDGRVTISSFLQLSTMELDSEWALQSTETAGGAKPRVSLVFTGPLQDIGRLQPKIDTTGLARYVTIRKMEKDVERLENLDVSGSKPKPGKTKSRPAGASAQAPRQVKEKAGQEPVQASKAPPGPVPPLPERKQTATRQKSAVPPAPPEAQPPAALEPPPAPAPAAVAVPSPDRKPVTAEVPPAATVPTQQTPAQPAAAEPQPAGTGIPLAAPLPARKPPVAPAPRPGTASAPAQLPPAAAPPPARQPVPPPATVTRPAPQPAPDLPWLQSVTPPPASSGAAQAPQGPIQLPTPSGTATGGPAPQPGQAPGTPPAAQTPAGRFDPFAEGSGN